MNRKFKLMALMVLLVGIGLSGCSNNEKVDNDTSNEDTAVTEEVIESNEEAADKEKDKNSEITDSDDESGESFFKKAEDDLMKALAPLPEGSSDGKIGAIESTLSNPFWITM